MQFCSGARQFGDDYCTLPGRGNRGDIFSHGLYDPFAQKPQPENDARGAEEYDPVLRPGFEKKTIPDSIRKFQQGIK